MINSLRKLIEDETKIKGDTSDLMRAKSSVLMLDQVRLMSEAFKQSKNGDIKQNLLDAFGLLQGLFVGVDALYDLAIGITRYKYHVNVNMNKNLHELKYIRNDIVGHPTHRTYPDGGIGFSILKELTRDKLTYETYIYSKNNLDVKVKSVKFNDLIKAFDEEKTSIVSSIAFYLRESKNETDIPEKLYVLFETLNKELLVEIVNEFKTHYGLENVKNHRFIWRFELLIKLIDWQEDQAFKNEVIQYLSRIQVSKMYDMALNLENRKNKELYVSLPSVVNDLYKFIRSHEKQAYPLLENLHDYTHPLFKSDLDALCTLNPKKGAKEIIDWLKEQNDERKVFLIGSIFKNYRKRH